MRAGAIGEAQLFAAYTERVPAASGGVWDRAEAIQRFDIAVRARDPGAIAANLPNAWRSLRDAGLSVAFAKAYGAALLAVNLPADMAELQLRLGLLAPEYEQFAAKITPQDPTLKFAVTLARGAPTSDVSDPLHAAIATAWSADVVVAEELQTKRESGDLGPVILRSLERLDTGARGDMRALTQGLAALRGLGLEDVARRAALQTLLTSPTQ